uniref:Uncharacterized protein n=1 Tax=Anopheles christyi TaxID=43041 RepID=A0A182KIS9_9DIPT
MSRISGEKIEPESYTCWICRPYENGEMFSMLSSFSRPWLFSR